MSTHTTSTLAHRTQTQPPRTMRAVVLTGHGGLDRLSVREDWPVPVPGSNEVLVAVDACGLNNTDVNTRTAWYSAGVSGATTGQALEAAAGADAAWGGSAISFPRIQGADVCGRVVALGSECNPSLLGRRVLIDPWLRAWNDPLDRDKCGYFGSECDGGFAQYTIVDARNVHPVTSEFSDADPSGGSAREPVDRLTGIAIRQPASVPVALTRREQLMSWRRLCIGFRHSPGLGVHPLFVRTRSSRTIPAARAPWAAHLR